MIKAILACDEEWGIGKDGDLPWPKNSDDLRWFKECTKDQAIVTAFARSHKFGYIF
jgi:dihydrofolate reductase